MKTSYFSKYKKVNGVSIAVGAPNWFKGEIYPDLFPTWELVNNYKVTGDEEVYTKAYHEKILSKLNPEKVYDDLQGKVVLCWEGKGKFCHRRIVAKWLEDNLGVEIEEAE